MLGTFNRVKVAQLTIFNTVCSGRLNKSSRLLSCEAPDFEQLKSTSPVRMYGFAAEGWKPRMEDELVISADKCLAGVFDGHVVNTTSEYAKGRFEKVFMGELSHLKLASGQGIMNAETTAAQQIPSGETVCKVFHNTAKLIDDEVISTCGGSGSTLCSVYINRSDKWPSKLENVDKSQFPYQIVSCNIGDSRAVLSRYGKAIQLTVDHKPDHPEEEKRIEKMGGFVDGGRLDGYLGVSRAIGHFRLRPKLSSEPDIVVHEGEWSQDEFIILATHGFWDVFTPQDAVDFVRHVLTLAKRDEEEDLESFKDILRIAQGVKRLYQEELTEESVMGSYYPQQIADAKARAKVRQKQRKDWMDELFGKQFKSLNARLNCYAGVQPRSRSLRAYPPEPEPRSNNTRDGSLYVKWTNIAEENMPK